MEWIEITAKTVEAAKEAALDQLGVDHDEAEFDVVEQPRQGLFRQSRGGARVRARVRPRTPRPKTERRPRSSGGADRASAKGKGGARKKSSNRSSNKKETADGTRRGDKAESASSNRSGNSAKKEEATMTMTLDEQVAAATSFLTGLLEAVGIDGRVSTERSDDTNADVKIEGDDLGMLIGPRGQTMNAIQDLTRISLQKQAAGSWEGHVHVDVNGYRARRREALVSFVEKIAADVRASGTAKALEPMASSDRKVVHDTVNAIEGVHTSSEGREPRRWVKIVPGDD